MLVSGYAVLLVFWVQPKRVTGEHRVDEAPLQHVAMPDTVSPMAATLDPRVEEVPEELVVEAPANIGRLTASRTPARNLLSPEPGTPGRSGCVPEPVHSLRRGRRAGA